jgi:hypothetical protein
MQIQNNLIKKKIKNNHLQILPQKYIFYLL